ncbi:hypothetical protein FQR65_LT20105 [Abscondita terminalis]|nr:hypothetical protein FQR65_LT20105 [Abscondita terminalis]
MIGTLICTVLCCATAAKNISMIVATMTWPHRIDRTISDAHYSSACHRRSANGYSQTGRCQAGNNDGRFRYPCIYGNAAKPSSDTSTSTSDVAASKAVATATRFRAHHHGHSARYAINKGSSPTSHAPSDCAVTSCGTRYAHIAARNHARRLTRLGAPPKGGALAPKGGPRIRQCVCGTTDKDIFRPPPPAPASARSSQDRRCKRHGARPTNRQTRQIPAAACKPPGRAATRYASGILQDWSAEEQGGFPYETGDATASAPHPMIELLISCHWFAQQT